MTLRYRAPEIMLGIQSYDAAVDMWSVGCIMAEMILGDTPFQGNGEVDQLMKIFEALGRPCPLEWPQVAHCENFHHSFPRWPRPASLAHVRPGPSRLRHTRMRTLRRKSEMQIGINSDAAVRYAARAGLGRHGLAAAGRHV